MAKKKKKTPQVLGKAGANESPPIVKKPKLK